VRRYRTGVAKCNNKGHIPSSSLQAGTATTALRSGEEFVSYPDCASSHNNNRYISLLRLLRLGRAYRLWNWVRFLTYKQTLSLLAVTLIRNFAVSDINGGKFLLVVVLRGGGGDEGMVQGCIHFTQHWRLS